MGGRFKKLRPVEYGSLQPGDGQLMSARARHGMLIGVAVILSTIAPAQTFAEFENTEWRVHDLYKQCNSKGLVDEVFCLEFVSSIARQGRSCIASSSAACVFGGAQVDLVGEEEVGEDRAGPELEVGLALVVDRGAGHVGGHQVGCELEAREADARHLREGARHQRLR